MRHYGGHWVSADQRKCTPKLNQQVASRKSFSYFPFYVFDRVTINVNNLTYLAMPKIARFLTSIKNRVLYCIFNIFMVISDLRQSFCKFCHHEFAIKLFVIVIIFKEIIWVLEKSAYFKASEEILYIFFFSLNPKWKDCFVFLGDCGNAIFSLCLTLVDLTTINSFLSFYWRSWNKFLELRQF